MKILNAALYYKNDKVVDLFFNLPCEFLVKGFDAFFKIYGNSVNFYNENDCLIYACHHNEDIQSKYLKVQLLEDKSDNLNSNSFFL